MQPTIIVQATEPRHYQAAKVLIANYLRFLGEDLSFQHVDAEMATLPHMYGGKNGCLLLAENDGRLVGMVALRKKTDTVCEMKRLFVLPSVTGLGIGKQLAVAIVEQATKMGFEEMVLDTLQRLQPALLLYKKFGFEEVGAYYDNPLPGVVFMRLNLG